MGVGTRMARKIVMMMPVAGFNALHVVSGSVIRNCESCQQQVYATAATIAMKQQEPECELLCIPCWSLAMEAEKQVEFCLIPGQVEELANDLLRGTAEKN